MFVANIERDPVDCRIPDYNTNLAAHVSHKLWNFKFFGIDSLSNLIMYEKTPHLTLAHVERVDTSIFTFSSLLLLILLLFITGHGHFQKLNLLKI